MFKEKINLEKSTLEDGITKGEIRKKIIEEYIEQEVQIRLNDKRFNIIKLKLNLLMAWFVPIALHAMHII